MQVTNKQVFQIEPVKDTEEAELLLWSDVIKAHRLNIIALEASCDSPCRIYFEKRSCNSTNLQIESMGSIRLTSYAPNYTLNMHGYTVNSGWNVFARVKFSNLKEAKPVEIGIVGGI